MGGVRSLLRIRAGQPGGVGLCTPERSGAPSVAGKGERPHRWGSLEKRHSDVAVFLAGRPQTKENQG